MQHLGTWFSCNLGTAGLMAGISNLKGLSNLNDSTILHSYVDKGGHRGRVESTLQHLMGVWYLSFLPSTLSYPHYRTKSLKGIGLCKLWTLQWGKELLVFL